MDECVCVHMCVGEARCILSQVFPERQTVLMSAVTAISDTLKSVSAVPYSLQSHTDDASSQKRPFAWL